ncbi:hypothetical protein GUJ93_ZPchr0003g16702 [Zizania palustris]|uniref:Uncharacterized protein n=1 Tax=Zizania palustris TaxID=103762 RepID=A0A8J5SAH5_ZIZPA|nr:hypothetical protein GUJ93_ZPchr0003g16702 [Zizania palustris]
MPTLRKTYHLDEVALLGFNLVWERGQSIRLDDDFHSIFLAYPSLPSASVLEHTCQLCLNPEGLTTNLQSISFQSTSLKCLASEDFSSRYLHTESLSALPAFD